MAKWFVLYHRHCHDGFGAAWAAWKKLGGGSEYIPVLHGASPPNLPAGSRVALVDFAYPRRIMEEIVAEAKQVQVLDHHLTAHDELAGLDYAHIDLSKSGAVLSWEYWHPEEPVPPLLAYVQDKDLWQFALPDSKEVTAALESYPLEFELWNTFTVKRLADEGRHILRLLQRQVSKTADQAFFQNIAGYNVPVVNATSNTSEVLGELNRRHAKAPFAAAYFDLGDGKRHWGLASVGAFDVSKIAKGFGGGGHRNRSGFMQPAGESIASLDKGRA